MRGNGGQGCTEGRREKVTSCSSIPFFPRNIKKEQRHVLRHWHHRQTSTSVLNSSVTCDPSTHPLCRSLTRTTSVASTLFLSLYISLADSPSPSLINPHTTHPLSHYAPSSFHLLLAHSLADSLTISTICSPHLALNLVPIAAVTISLNSWKKNMS